MWSAQNKIKNVVYMSKSWNMLPECKARDETDKYITTQTFLSDLSQLKLKSSTN